MLCIACQTLASCSRTTSHHDTVFHTVESPCHLAFCVAVDGVGDFVENIFRVLFLDRLDSKSIEHVAKDAIHFLHDVVLRALDFLVVPVLVHVLLDRIDLARREFPTTIVLVHQAFVEVVLRIIIEKALESFDDFVVISIHLSLLSIVCVQISNSSSLAFCCTTFLLFTFFDELIHIHRFDILLIFFREAGVFDFFPEWTIKGESFGLEAIQLVLDVHVVFLPEKHLVVFLDNVLETDELLLLELAETERRPDTCTSSDDALTGRLVLEDVLVADGLATTLDLAVVGHALARVKLVVNDINDLEVAVLVLLDGLDGILVLDGVLLGQTAGVDAIFGNDGDDRNRSHDVYLQYQLPWLPVLPCLLP